jgi:branched-chain amino acid transport system permease protein
MSASIFMQILVGGIVLGSIYALVAFGLSLIYGVVRILNFAHGTFLAVIAIVACVLFKSLGIPPAAIIVLLIPPVAVFAYGFYIVLLDPLFAKSPSEMAIGTVLVTVGALLILSDVAAFVAGTSLRSIQIESGVFIVGGVILSTTNIAIMLGIVALVFIIHLVLRNTWLGVAIRAVTQDQFGARICGIPSVAIRASTFAFAYAVVTAAAVFYAMTYPVDPYLGLGLTVKAFTIIVLGGIGSLPGTLLAGFLLGVTEAFTSFYVGTAWAPAASILLLLGMLVLMPQGIVLRKNAQRWRAS